MNKFFLRHAGALAGLCVAMAELYVYVARGSDGSWRSDGAGWTVIMGMFFAPPAFLALSFSNRILSFLARVLSAPRALVLTVGGALFCPLLFITALAAFWAFGALAGGHSPIDA